MPLSQMFDKVFGMIKTDIREPSGGQTPENLENSENYERKSGTGFFFIDKV